MKKLVLRSLLIRYHKDIPRTHDVHKRPNNGITTPHRRTRSISLLLQHIVPRFVTAQRARRLQRNRPLTSLPSEKRSYDFSMTIRRFPCAIVPYTSIIKSKIKIITPLSCDFAIWNGLHPPNESFRQSPEPIYAGNNNLRCSTYV